MRAPQAIKTSRDEIRDERGQPPVTKWRSSRK